jgi:glycine cleavage system H protein
MKTPTQLKYTPSHEWIADAGDGTLKTGITDFAQEQLGDIVFVELPKAGQHYAEGAVCGVIESVKAVSDIYMPVAGAVVTLNDAVAKKPEQINADPYGAWMFSFKPDRAADAAKLLDAAAYESQAHT